jgi:hypothetical protein
MADSNVFISTSNPERLPGASCAPGRVAGCEPECLVHPQFFCGQLLTDQDLNDLLAWAKNKFQLSRYRLGWGVVCGLQVTCDPNDPSAVLVASGYALDPCGNDIVLCKPDRLSLSEACRLPPTICADPSSGMAKLGGSSDSQGEYLLVDLYVRYKAVPGNPLPALGRGACTEQEACEPSRTEESYELYWRDASGSVHPLQSELEVWECNYFSQCREVVDRVVEVAKGGNGYDY